MVFKPWLVNPYHYVVSCWKNCIDLVTHFSEDYVKKMQFLTLSTSSYLDKSCKHFCDIWEPFKPRKISKHSIKTQKDKVALKQASTLDDLVVSLKS